MSDSKGVINRNVVAIFLFYLCDESCLLIVMSGFNI